jgi:hypothetical protein
VNTLPQRALDSLQTHAVAALDSSMVSQALHARSGNPKGEEMARSTTESVRAMVGILQRLGAHEDQQSAAALAQPIPFHALDTPDVRQLLAGLEALLPIAERVDAARGRAGAEVVGGSAGFDLAEDLVQLIARISLEVHGPGAAVTGARE